MAHRQLHSHLLAVLSRQAVHNTALHAPALESKLVHNGVGHVGNRLIKLAILPAYLVPVLAEAMQALV